LLLLSPTEVASESLKGRVLEANAADLVKDEEKGYLKFRLRIDDVQGKNCLTNFHGLSLTTDKLKGLVRKWQSLIEGSIDVKTQDGYLLRVFVIGFTKRRQNQVKQTSYAQTAQIRQIRKKMFKIITRESQCDLKDLVAKLYVCSLSLALIQRRRLTLVVTTAPPTRLARRSRRPPRASTRSRTSTSAR